MATATQTELPADVRVTLVRNEFLSEYGGRLKAGTAVLVDEKTARRWLDKGIAVPAEEADKTLAEQKRLELERLKAEIEELETSGQRPASKFGRPGGVPARRG